MHGEAPEKEAGAVPQAVGVLMEGLEERSERVLGNGGTMGAPLHRIAARAPKVPQVLVILRAFRINAYPQAMPQGNDGLDHLPVLQTLLARRSREMFLP